MASQNPRKLRPLTCYLVVQHSPSDRPSGLHLPANSEGKREVDNRWEVLAVGPDVKNLEKGDMVMLAARVVKSPYLTKFPHVEPEAFVIKDEWVAGKWSNLL